jgi:hypothetical protein
MAKSGMSNAHVQSVLSREFGSVAYTPPVTWHVGVSTTQINPDGTGATEPSGGGYARVAVSNNTASWENIPADVGRRNLTVIEFPPATASWGTVTFVPIYDAPTGGVLRYYVQLTNSKVVGVDDVLRFEAGQLQIKILPTTV